MFAYGLFLCLFSQLGSTQTDYSLFTQLHSCINEIYVYDLTGSKNLYQFCQMHSPFNEWK